VFLLTFFVFSVSQVSAAKIITSEEGTAEVSKGEVVNDDLFIGAATAVIDGTVNGDVFIAAQTVRIGGVVNGNLHVGTQNLTLEGATVSGSIYLGSQNVVITGTNIKGSLIAGTQTLNIDKTSSVGGSVITGSAVLTLDSPVKRNAMIGSGMLTLGDNVRIGRDLYYATGSDKANISDKAVVTGATHKYEAQTPEPQISKEQTSKFFAGAKAASTIVSYLGSLLIGLLLFKFFQKRFIGAATLISKSFWKSLGIGFLIIISMVPALLILLITIIGIPVAGFVLTIIALYMSLTKIVVGLAVGNFIATKAHWKIDTFWPFALGLLIIYVLKSIPVAGGLIGFFVMLVGLGALFLQTSKGE
jgi:hypothetical protein